MKRIVLSTVIASMVLVLGASEALARRGGGPGSGRGGGFGPGMMAELDLTAQQQDAIRALRTQQEEQLAPIRAKLDALRVKLHAAWSAPNPNASEIQALHKQMDPLRQQLRQAKVDLRLDVLEILTPAQRAKYTQAMKNRGPGKGMRGRGMGRGAGCPWAVDQGMSSPGW